MLWIRAFLGNAEIFGNAGALIQREKYAYNETN